ncbi:dihydroxyacetone kinase subunit DhaL [Streptomyces sp. CB01881]|uniref:dihydroxyacetone kinase subunit DhaL n=1 Tax=Streptomyces sp. CB01881 TaxID=2078691 RepID=UPI000CDBD235|nr:dihydroxyacetone kinase subunit DhaL [Streptomyces sp. CB01881]AUY49548.1 dihydroxyacetone kinase subunit L [Streptomyces sp. CB01881]TYC72938.1 dihydroxyacetone kinase subunit L [Streptomyces sp. CB01881]
MDFDTPLAEAWVRAIAAAVEKEAQRLTELDSAIGDGDHGSNLRRGFTAVLAALDGLDPAGPGAVLTRTGTTLISKVGGASGPLYGKAFRALGAALPGPAGPAAFGEALAAGLQAVRGLGRAEPGDKTIVDAWTPALAAYRAAVAAGADLPRAAGAAADAAGQGALDTVPLQARKGRASYLGPRSVGHQDPGAASTALVFRALAEVTAAQA